jgi:ribosomal protein S18 acetylase RimI-like enzyme
MEQELTIRQFELADTDSVIKLWKKSFPTDPPWNDPQAIITRKYSYQSELFLVGELHNKVIATVLGGYDGFRGWVYHLAVIDDNRRRGIGKKMMFAIEQKLRQLGCIKMNIQVRSSNQDVILFYNEIGFEIEDHVSLGKLLQET